MKAGWKTPKFGDVCELRKGKKPTLVNAGAEGAIPYLVAKYLRGSAPTEFALASDKNSVSVSANEIIIICDGSNSGETFIGFDGILSSTMAKIGHGKEIDNRFLMHFLDSLFDKFNAAKTGAAIPHLDLAGLREEALPIPDITEQHRIVAILDEAFDGIATAKANAEKNLQNARTLFNTYLHDAYLGRGADGWPMRRLGDVFEIGSSKRIHERDWSPSGVPFYGGKEIVKLANFGHAISNAYISEQKYQDYASKYDMPKPGDILITARGTIGVGYVVQNSDKFYYKDGNIISMRAKEAANPHYLLYAFRSNALAEQLGELSGTTVTHLPLEKAKALLLRVPEIGIQDAMVERIMEFEGETQRLASLYQQKLTALDDLKKSLLHQAFSGQL